MFNYIVLLRSVLFWDIAQCIVVTPYCCFRTAFQSHLQRSRSWPTKMGLTGCPELLVRNYHYLLCNISEAHISFTLWQKLEITHSLVASCRLLRRPMQNPCGHQQHSSTVYKKRSKVISGGRLQVASLVSWRMWGLPRSWSCNLCGCLCNISLTCWKSSDQGLVTEVGPWHHGV